MRVGSLVKFTTASYHDWGLGLILRPYDVMDRDNRIRCFGFYYVMTQLGQKLVSDSYMEELSVDSILVNETW